MNTPDHTTQDTLSVKGAAPADELPPLNSEDDAPPTDKAPTIELDKHPESPRDISPAQPQPVVEYSETLPESHDGEVHTLQFTRFGEKDARPKVYLQAGLHADEFPGQLVLRELSKELKIAAERGELIGQVIVLPVANPIGLAQRKGGTVQGRIEDETGRNFNRGYPDLAALARRRIVGKFDTKDAEKNVAKIRAGMQRALSAIEPSDAFEALQLCVLRHACDADIVLDFHADNEAQIHIYTHGGFWPSAQDLAAEIDARAVLLCDESGGDPFDEACSKPWFQLAAKQKDAAIPPACFSATVELRSNNDVDWRDARRDARGLLRFLQRRGVIAGEAGSLPRLLCEATPLEAMQQVKAPVSGLVVYRLRLGDTVYKGDCVAEIIPPAGEVTEVHATTDGKLFARHNQAWAWEGKVIAKIAGAEPLPERTGHLLTD